MEVGADLDVVIVGGLGHVGLPLALAFADAGLMVGIYDRDRPKAAQVRAGHMPFAEEGAQRLLDRCRERLVVSIAPTIVSRTHQVVVVVGTKVDEFLQPSLRTVDRVMEELEPLMRLEALLVLRSTVFPGTTARLAARERYPVAYCPERSVQGLALEGILSLPQIVGAEDAEARMRACRLFEALGVETVILSSLEAELAKLYTNAWRYMWFAVGNELFEVSSRAGVDHAKVLDAMRHEYPRAAALPGPGFTAGPCLMKDTLQLAAFDPMMRLGPAAREVNEGLPDHLTRMLKARHGSLDGKRVTLLGMAFKSESDDIRDSLSFKLLRLLEFEGASVVCSDPYVPGLGLATDVAIDGADVVVVCVPHPEYRGLTFPEHVDVVDPWEVRSAAGAEV